MKVLSGLSAMCLVVGNLAAFSASAASIEDDLQRLEEARAAVWAEFYAELESMDISTERASELLRSNTQKPIKDYEYYVAVKPSYNANGYSGIMETSGTFSTTYLTARGIGRGDEHPTGETAPAMTVVSSSFDGYSNTTGSMYLASVWSLSGAVKVPDVHRVYFTVKNSSGLPSGVTIGSCFSVTNDDYDTTHEYMTADIKAIGDADSNGVITSNDVQKILDHVAYELANLTDPNWSYYDSISCDVNFTNSITTRDATIVYSYLENSFSSMYEADHSA